MRVSVDPLACEANAVCVGLVPRVFSIAEDDEGDDVLAIADDGVVPPGYEEAVRDAVRRCPKMALSAVD
jgi:ferredoxin